jgi:hypothetical protein
MIFILLLTLTILSFVVLQCFALSPSFVKEEILAAPNDWIFWKDKSQDETIITHDNHTLPVENAKTMRECKTTKYISPSIGSVSYISDGKVLNATLWLTDGFKQLPSFDKIDIYPAYLIIETSALPSTETFRNYAYTEMQRIEYENANNMPVINENTTYSISGHNAFKLVYDATEYGINIKNMTMWTFNNGIVYNMTYSAMEDKYNITLPIIQKIINSLKFENSSTNYNTEFHPISKGYVLFRGLGMDMDYPADWKVKQGNHNESFIFKAPYADVELPQPSWHETTFTMALAIDSVEHPGPTDYRVEYSRELNHNSNIGSWQWNKKVYEVSALDRTRLMEEEKNFSFYNGTNPYYILFSFNLSKINFPQQYRAVFYITDFFVIHHHLCRLVDTTPWAIIPPPDFTISATSSTPLMLRPGDERDIEITIKGNTHLPSEAFLSPSYHNGNNDISYNKKLIEVSFIPNRTSIMQYGSATSTMHVKALDNDSEPNPYGTIIPISANISFPTTITNRAGQIFNNSKNVDLLQTSYLTLTILPPYSLGEKFNSFVSTWVTPMTGIWTFLAGVAAVLAPVIIHFYRKKEKNDQYV